MAGPNLSLPLQSQRGTIETAHGSLVEPGRQRDGAGSRN